MAVNISDQMKGHLSEAVELMEKNALLSRYATPGEMFHNLGTIHLIETGGRLNPQSWTGVRGSMQVTNATFNETYNKHADILQAAGVPRNREDPRASAIVGSLYYNGLHNTFQGNATAAAVAYNSGPGAGRNYVNGNFSAIRGQGRDYAKKFERDFPKVAEFLGGLGPSVGVDKFTMGAQMQHLFDRIPQAASDVATTDLAAGQSGRNLFTTQVVALHAAELLRENGHGDITSGIDVEALEQEMGVMPEDHPDRVALETMSEPEKEAFFKARNIVQQDGTWYDLDQTKAGEQTQKLLNEVGQTYASLSDEQKQALKEKAEAQDAKKQKEFDEFKRDFAQAAGNAGLSEDEVMLLMLAYLVGGEELYNAVSAQLGFNGPSPSNYVSTPGYDRGPVPVGYHAPSNQEAFTSLVHTGGLDVKGSDIASAETLASIAGKTGVSVERLQTQADRAAKVLNSLHPDIKAGVLTSMQQSWANGTPVVLSPSSLNGNTNDQFTIAARGSLADIDPRLAHVIQEAAKDFPLRVEVRSLKYRNSNGLPRSGVHGTGRAIDIILFDQAGNPIGNYQNSENFRAYEAFWQVVHLKTREFYPELADGKGYNINWGGYFGGAGPNNSRYKYGSADLMDFRIEPDHKFRAGTFAGGLNRQHGWYDNGDLHGGSQGYLPEALAQTLQDLETFRMTPEQAAHNRRTMFGVAKGTKPKAPRPDSYFFNRRLAFDVVPLGADGNPAANVDIATQRELAQIFAAHGFAQNQGMGELAFHVGATEDYKGLTTQPGSREKVPGGLPVIPEEWKHKSWQEASAPPKPEPEEVKKAQSVANDLFHSGVVLAPLDNFKAENQNNNNLAIAAALARIKEETRADGTAVAGKGKPAPKNTEQEIREAGVAASGAGVKGAGDEKAETPSGDGLPEQVKQQAGAAAGQNR